jgi:hypothetical protein
VLPDQLQNPLDILELHHPPRIKVFRLKAEATLPTIARHCLELHQTRPLQYSYRHVR